MTRAAAISTLVRSRILDTKNFFVCEPIFKILFSPFRSARGLFRGSKRMDFGRQFVGILFCEHLRSLRGANSWHQAKKPQKCFSDFRSILIKCVPPTLVLKKVRQIVCSQKQKREKGKQLEF